MFWWYCGPNNLQSHILPEVPVLAWKPLVSLILTADSEILCSQTPKTHLDPSPYVTHSATATAATHPPTQWKNGHIVRMGPLGQILAAVLKSAFKTASFYRSFSVPKRTLIHVPHPPPRHPNPTAKAALTFQCLDRFWKFFHVFMKHIKIRRIIGKRPPLGGAFHLNFDFEIAFSQ